MDNVTIIVTLLGKAQMSSRLINLFKWLFRIHTKIFLLSLIIVFVMYFFNFLRELSIDDVLDYLVGLLAVMVLFLPALLPYFSAEYDEWNRTGNDV